MRQPRFYENPSCAEIGGDFWFPEKADGSSNSLEMVMAKSICRSCPHKAECAEWGIQKELHGIWGGLASKERSTIRAQRKIILKEEGVA
jgi:WhiB family redox-sensing transcriptional regulator